MDRIQGVQERKQKLGVQEDITARVKWLSVIRMGISVFGVLLIFVFFRESFQLTSIFSPIAVLIYGFIFSILCLVVQRHITNLRMFAGLQIVLDITWITCLVYLTGGVSSVFKIYYFISIFIASMIFSMGANITFASVSVISLSVVAMVYSFGYGSENVLPFVPKQWTPSSINELSMDIATLLPFSVSLYIVAILSGLLSQRLKGEIILKEEILDNISDGIIVLDRYDRLVFFNSNALAFLGVRRLRRNIRLDDISSEIPQDKSRVIQRIFNDRTPKSIRAMITNEGGEAMPLGISTTLLVNSNGKYRGMIATIQDLTIREKMERALKQAEKFEMLRKVSAGMAHEIRNPLASMRGSAQELTSVESMSEEDLQLLNVIVNESDRLDHILTNFIQYARMPKPILGKCDLRTVIDEVKYILDKRSGNGKIVIINDVANDLKCLGDYDQLKQVFLNIGINAIEAMETGGKLTIKAYTTDEVKLDEDFPVVRIDFIDEGKGVPRELIDSIFQPFVTTKDRGTGLGLAIVESIVNVHKGVVEVSDNDNGGTIFSVYLLQCLE